MPDDWIDVLTEGTYELALPSLVFRHGRTGDYKGSGRAVWTADKGIRVLASTDHPESAWELINFELVPGRLYPPEEYLNFSGQTVDGGTVTARPAVPGGVHLHAESPGIPWDQGVRGLTIDSPQESNSGLRILRAVLGPPPNDWPRTTLTTVANPYFGRKRGVSDWLALEGPEWNLAARQRTKEWFELRLVLPSGAHGERTSDHLWAVSSAFGFLIGRNLFIRGYEEVSQERCTRFIEGADRGPTKVAMRPPLDSVDCLGDMEGLLGDLLTYFLTESGRRTAELLWVCRSSGDTSMSTHQVVTSVCLEGLLKIAGSGRQANDTELVAREVASLRELMSANRDRLSERFRSRIDGFLAGLGHQRPKDILYGFLETGLFSVDKGDIAAWEKTRNPAAHAGFVGVEEDAERYQTNLDKLFRLEDLINRLVLGVVGYRGKYVSYRDSPWQVREFPGG